MLLRHAAKRECAFSLVLPYDASLLAVIRRGLLLVYQTDANFAPRSRDYASNRHNYRVTGNIGQRGELSLAMKTASLIILATLAVGCEQQTAGGTAPRQKVAVVDRRKAAVTAKASELTFLAKDGVTVFADFYKAEPAKGIILLFHQAGSNAGEYATIAPVLVSQGYDALAVDQRNGGDMWNRKNRTAAKRSGDYLSAYADMEGAVQWAKAKKYSVIVAWGSSYSASLVLRLAKDYPELRAVLAFSPGEYFSNPTLVRDWNMAENVPTLMAFTPDEASQGGVTLYQSSSHAPARNDADMILSFEGGVHGSSTLNPDKNPTSSKKYWQGVIAFLRSHAK